MKWAQLTMTWWNVKSLVEKAYEKGKACSMAWYGLWEGTPWKTCEENVIDDWKGNRHGWKDSNQSSGGNGNESFANYTTKRKLGRTCERGSIFDDFWILGYNTKTQRYSSEISLGIFGFWELSKFKDNETGCT